MQDSPSRKPPSSLPTSDRRQEARYPVRPVEYIEVGENNGGIILDICENGMAVSAAQPLGGEQILRLRFQLPRFPDAIETVGEISWIGESKKRAGIRFIALTESAREQIQRWIILQSSDATHAGGVPRIVPGSAPDSLRPATTSDQTNPPNPAKSGDAFSTTASPAFVTPQEAESEISENLAPAHEPQAKLGAEKAAAERRAQVRKPVAASSYLHLSDGNAGLAANFSEGGLSFRAAKSLQSDQILVRFQLPGSDQFIESPALIVWKSPSKKKVGARFLCLPDDARNQIAEWIGSGGVGQDAVDSAERSSSVAKTPGAGTSPVAGATGTSDISTLTDNSISEPAASAASRVTAAKLSALPEPAFAAERTTLPIPAELPDQAKLELPAFLAPRIRAAHNPSANVPISALSGSDESAVPVVYKASSWYGAPKESNGFWKIAALMVLIGGACFGGGIFFSGSRQIAVSSYGNANQASDSASAPQTREAERSASDSSSQPSVAAPATASDTAGPESVGRDTGNPVNDRSVLQRRADSGKRMKSASQLTDATEANQPLPGPPAATESVTAREKAGNFGTSGGANDRAAALHQENAPVAVANGERSQLKTDATHSQNSQHPKPAAIPAESQRTQPAPGPAAADALPSTPASSPAVVNAPSPALAQNRVGSISFFSRFRAIRASGDPSSGSAASGVLQIGALRSNPMPAYPVQAQLQQVQGLVELDVMVGSAGEVQSVRLIKGPPELAAVAIKAVRSWQFAPTLLGGHPVETEQSVIFTFKVGS